MIEVKVPVAIEKQIIPLTMKKMEKIFYDVVPILMSPYPTVVIVVTVK
jgi:hypothetical protein